MDTMTAKHTEFDGPIANDGPTAAAYKGQASGCSAKFIAHDMTSAVNSDLLATSNFFGGSINGGTS
jgi:hypothetical protein